MIISGKDIAESLYKELSKKFAALGRKVRLGIIVVGKNPVIESFVKIKTRSDYYSTLEGGRGGYMPRYGLMHLLACFTLFDDDAQLVNGILDGFLAVTREEIQAVAKKYLRPENRAIVFRTPVAKETKEAA